MEPPTISTSLEKLGYLVETARAFEAQLPPDEQEEGRPIPDDRALAVLEAGSDSPADEELRAALADLDTDERAETLALVWIARGDWVMRDWRHALAQGRSMGRLAAIDYLMTTPLLGDLIEEGLDALGYSVEDLETGPSGPDAA